MLEQTQLGGSHDPSTSLGTASVHINRLTIQTATPSFAAPSPRMGSPDELLLVIVNLGAVPSSQGYRAPGLGWGLAGLTRRK
jgi:hypothetical protein